MDSTSLITMPGTCPTGNLSHRIHGSLGSLITIPLQTSFDSLSCSGPGSSMDKPPPSWCPMACPEITGPNKNQIHSLLDVLLGGSIVYLMQQRRQPNEPNMMGRSFGISFAISKAMMYSIMHSFMDGLNPKLLGICSHRCTNGKHFPYFQMIQGPTTMGLCPREAAQLQPLSPRTGPSRAFMSQSPRVNCGRFRASAVR